MNSRLACLLMAAFSVLPAATLVYANEVTYEVYGALKASINNTDDGSAGSALGVSSNSTRIGWRGKTALIGGGEAFFKIEGEIDISERSKTEFARRNAYVGIRAGFGEVFLGQHDTPLKKVRKTLFADTIADSRTLLSVQTGTSVATTDSPASAELDDRVTNAIGYKSPKFAGGAQAFVLYSAAAEAEAESTGNDNNYFQLFSANFTFKTKSSFYGVGVLQKSTGTGVENLTAVRLTASHQFYKSLKMGCVIETADQGSGSLISRDALLVYTEYSIPNSIRLGLQYAQVSDFDASVNTGAKNISIGAVKKLAKPTAIYAIYTLTRNDEKARFGLAQGGVGDRIQAFDVGDNVSALSIGMTHKF